MSKTEWKTSRLVWESKNVKAYLIGYFHSPQEALKVKKALEAQHGIKVVADVRLIGLVEKKT